MASKAIKINDYEKDIPGKVDPEDPTVYMFPQIISHGNRGGKKSFWRALVRVFAEGANGAPQYKPILPEYFKGADIGALKAEILIVSKLEGGKVRDVTPTIVSVGKNIGRANATNPFTQALRDALGLHNKQLQKSKIDGPETLTAPSTTARPDNLAAKIYEKEDVTARFYPPMLAQMLEDQEITFPAYIQPKLNGVRVVMFYDPGTKEIYIYSRSKKAYPGFDYIKKELAPVLSEFPGLYLDGEMYLHSVSLQEISGIARRALTESIKEARTLKYNIFDAFMPDRIDVPFSARMSWLDKLFAFKFDHIARVPTYKVDGMPEIQDHYKKWMKEGYEGAIVRLDAPYVFSYRAYHAPVLLKMKQIMEDEFKIVGYTRGKKGKAADALMLVLETPAGKQFNVTPAMPIAERNALYKKMDQKDGTGRTFFERHYLGKPYTIQYQELSKDNIPVQARGEVVRDYE